MRPAPPRAPRIGPALPIWPPPTAATPARAYKGSWPSFGARSSATTTAKAIRAAGWRRTSSTASEVPAGDPSTLRAELAVLNAFADVASLSRNRRGGEDEEAEDVHSPREFFHAFLQTMDATRAGLPPSFEARLRAALADYDVGELEPTPALEDALFWMYLAQQRNAALVPAVLAILRFHLHHPDGPENGRDELLDSLDRLILATQLRHPVVGALARSVRFRLFDEPLIEAARRETLRMMGEQLSLLATTADTEKRAERMKVLVSCPLPLIRLMAALGEDQEAPRRELIEVQTRRYYQVRDLAEVRCFDRHGKRMVTGTFDDGGERMTIVSAATSRSEPTDLAGALAAVGAELGPAAPGVADVYLTAGPGPDEARRAFIAATLAAVPLPAGLRRVTVSVPTAPLRMSRSTFERHGDGFRENPILRDLHPMIAERLQLWRLSEFSLRRLPAPEDIYLFEATARANPDDRRLVALAEVRDLTPLRDGAGSVTAIPALEQVLDSCLDGMRRAMADFASPDLPQWNRIVLHAWPPIELDRDELLSIVRGLAPRTGDIGLEQVGVQGRIQTPDGLREVRLRMARPPGQGLTFEVTPPPQTPLKPLDGYAQLVMRAQRRHTVYPYELIPLLLGPPGSCARRRAGRPWPRSSVSTTSATDGTAQVVARRYGENTSGIVFGTVTTPTSRYPEGMTRVVILGDPTKSLGSLAEPECRRILAAIDLADSLGAPVEWFAVSSGAKIAMDSGTENMDWVARVLRRLVEFTQAGGEVNVVVAGHQRRRPAVLERRGHHADAHQRHPGHDPRQRHGPHRQAGPRVLGGRRRRGQLRHRRLRPHHGPQRPSPVLGRRPGPGRPDPAGALRLRLRGARRAFRPPGRHRRPRRSRCAAQPP